jgi:ribokinase
VTTLFNPSPMLTPDELRAFPWSNLNWLIVNEGEIQDLLRAFGSAAETDSGDVGSLIQKLYDAEGFDRGVKVVCTLGAEGVMWAVDGKGESIGRLAAGKLEKGVRDTTGAGDCFLGYLTAGLMRGESLEEALNNCLAVCLGNCNRPDRADDQACAICVENEGAMDSMPTLADAKKRATL